MTPEEAITSVQTYKSFFWYSYKFQGGSGTSHATSRKLVPATAPWITLFISATLGLELLHTQLLVIYLFRGTIQKQAGRFKLI